MLVSISLIEVLDAILQQVGSQQIHIALIAKANIRLDAQQMEVGTDQIHAVGMDGADLCRRKQSHLFSQIGLGRVGGKQLLQPFRNALIHLSRGGVGERYHQQLTRFHRVSWIGENVDDTLNQNGSLAAAGSCRQQQGTFSQINGLFLFFCPIWLRHLLTSLAVSFF